MNPENNEQPIEQVVPKPVTSTAYQAGPTLQANDVVRPQTIFSKTKVIHLAYALMVGIVGFGSCWFVILNADVESAYLIPSIVYLISAIFTLSSIIAVFRVNPATGLSYSLPMKIFVIITGLAIGGWSAYWGIYGTLLGLGIMDFPSFG